MWDREFGSLDRAAQEMHGMEQDIRGLERQLDRASQENYELKQRIRELEGSLLHCARCGRGIGEVDETGLDQG